MGRPSTWSPHHRFGRSADDGDLHRIDHRRIHRSLPEMSNSRVSSQIRHRPAHVHEASSADDVGDDEAESTEDRNVSHCRETNSRGACADISRREYCGQRQHYPQLGRVRNDHDLLVHGRRSSAIQDNRREQRAWTDQELSSD